MTTLYYPRTVNNRWRWSAVISDGSSVNPVDSCTMVLCDGHDTPDDAVCHHAEFICIHSTLIRKLSVSEMRPCAVCSGWSEHYAMLSLCPYNDRVYVCERHTDGEARQALRRNHFKWRGVMDKGVMLDRPKLDRISAHYLGRVANGNE